MLKTFSIVIDNGVEVAEKWRLQDAKEYAERRLKSKEEEK